MERGTKGHQLVSSMQMSENFGSNLLMGGGGAQGCMRMADNHWRTPPPPLWSDGDGGCGGALAFVSAHVRRLRGSWPKRAFHERLQRRLPTVGTAVGR